MPAKAAPPSICAAQPAHAETAGQNGRSAHVTCTVNAEVGAVLTTGADEAFCGTAYHTLVKMGSAPGKCVIYHACLP